MRYGVRLSFLVATLATAPAHAGWFGPSDRDECMADAAKKPTNDGVRLAMMLCRKNFPPSKRDCEVEAEDWRKGVKYDWNAGTRSYPPVPPGHCPDAYPALFKKD